MGDELENWELPDYDSALGGPLGYRRCPNCGDWKLDRHFIKKNLQCNTCRRKRQELQALLSSGE